MSLLGGLNKDDNIERSADSVGFSALESELKACKNKYQDNSNKDSKFSLR